MGGEDLLSHYLRVYEVQLVANVELVDAGELVDGREAAAKLGADVLKVHGHLWRMHGGVHLMLSHTARETERERERV